MLFNRRSCLQGRHQRANGFFGMKRRLNRVGFSAQRGITIISGDGERIDQPWIVKCGYRFQRGKAHRHREGDVVAVTESSDVVLGEPLLLRTCEAEVLSEPAVDQRGVPEPATGFTLYTDTILRVLPEATAPAVRC